jgi:glutaredoxin
MTEYTILSKRLCPYSIRAEELLKERGLKYKVYYAGSDFTVKEFKERYGFTATFPRVYKNKNYIGGCEELEKLL